MKPLLFLSILIFAVSSCGRIGSTLKSDSITKSLENSNGLASSQTPSTSDDAKTLKLTAKQKKIIANGKELDWKVNGLSWKIPKDSNKLLERDMILTYRSPSSVTLVASVTPSQSYDRAVSIIKGHYEQAVINEKNNLVEQVRYLELDGIKGIEFIEKIPNNDGWQRHQWIAYREFNKQPQIISVMCGTEVADFENNKDICAATLYSIKVKN